MYTKNERSSYRHRGLKCGQCKVHTMVFGQDPIPLNCPTCSVTGSLTVEWDHMVTQEVTVETYNPQKHG